MRLGGYVTKKKRQWARELRNNQTRAEDRLWTKLRKQRLDGWAFRRQVVLCGFIVDFFCLRARLVVEVDGSIHLTQQGYDAWRAEILERELGVKVVRVTNSLVLGDRGAALETMRAALAARSPGQPERWSDVRWMPEDVAERDDPCWR
jgi:very-short-patch-repair endonuclease